jgi:rhodanese-related sulfurtransferase
MGLRIGTVVNLPLTHLSELSAKLDPMQPVVTVCNSAYRSSMAVGLLERKGFKQVGSLAGGSEAWISAGLPVFGADQKPGAGSPASATTPKRTVKLPERIAASELKNLIMDLPGTFDLVDIRPPSQYADYSIPGSQNADVAEVMSNPAYLTGAGPLIIVDRDGSLAMAVAGILSQKSQRPIKALYGGVVSYWQESELKNAVKPVAIQGMGASPGAPPRAPGMTERPAGAVAAPETAPKIPPSSSPQVPVPPQPPKTKSAGC